MTGAALALAPVLAGGLFAVGLFGLIARRTILFQLIALEVMLTAPALVFVAAGAKHGAASGQAMFALVLTLAAAEVAIGLALYLRLAGIEPTADGDAVDRLGDR